MTDNAAVCDVDNDRKWCLFLIAPGLRAMKRCCHRNTLLVTTQPRAISADVHKAVCSCFVALATTVAAVRIFAGLRAAIDSKLLAALMLCHICLARLTPERAALNANISLKLYSRASKDRALLSCVLLVVHRPSLQAATTDSGGSLVDMADATTLFKSD
eukprot:4902-Heterococcus_DN1.PRE.2